MVHSSNKMYLFIGILFLCLQWKSIYGQFGSNNAGHYNMQDHHSVNDVSEGGHTHVQQTPQSSSFHRGNDDNQDVFGELSGINMYGVSQKFNFLWRKFGPLLRAAGCFIGKVIVTVARMVISSVSTECQPSACNQCLNCPPQSAETPPVPKIDTCSCQQKRTASTAKRSCGCNSDKVAPKPIDIVGPHQAGTGAHSIVVIPTQSCSGCPGFLTSKLCSLSNQITCFLAGSIKSLMESIIEKVEYLTGCNSGCGTGINMYNLSQKFKMLVAKLAPILHQLLNICARTIKNIVKSLFLTKFGNDSSCRPCNNPSGSCGSSPCASNTNNIPITGINMVSDHN